MLSSMPEALQPLATLGAALAAAAAVTLMCSKKPAEREKPPEVGRISARVAQMNQSATVAMTEKSFELKIAGKDVLALSVGEPDFDPPQEVRDATIDAVTASPGGELKTRYTSVSGTKPLRDKIAEYLTNSKQTPCTSDQILVSNGGKQSLVQAILAFTGPGDEVIVPAPYWVSYTEQCTLAGSTPVVIRTDPEAGFLLDPEVLDTKINSHTRMLILCNPSNPTGSVYPREHLEKLAAVVRKHPQIIVISDEIYEKITFDTPHVAFASLDGMAERTLTVNGFSKAFAMTGFRIGYLAGPQELIAVCTKVQGQLTSCASSVGQHAALAALSMDASSTEKYFKEAVDGFRQKRDFVLAELESIDGIPKCATPEGAFYIFPVVEKYFGAKKKDGTGIIKDSSDLCMHILDQDKPLALVPGSAFGEARCLRISYATSMENLKEAMNRLKLALSQLERVA